MYEAKIIFPYYIHICAGYYLNLIVDFPHGSMQNNGRQPESLRHAHPWQRYLQFCKYTIFRKTGHLKNTLTLLNSQKIWVILSFYSSYTRPLTPPNSYKNNGQLVLIFTFYQGPFIGQLSREERDRERKKTQRKVAKLSISIGSL